MCRKTRAAESLQARVLFTVLSKLPFFFFSLLSFTQSCDILLLTCTVLGCLLMQMWMSLFTPTAIKQTSTSDRAIILKVGKQNKVDYQVKKKDWLQCDTQGIPVPDCNW